MQGKHKEWREGPRISRTRNVTSPQDSNCSSQCCRHTCSRESGVQDCAKEASEWWSKQMSRVSVEGRAGICGGVSWCRVTFKYVRRGGHVSGEPVIFAKVRRVSVVGKGDPPSYQVHERDVSETGQRCGQWRPASCPSQNERLRRFGGSSMAWWYQRPSSSDVKPSGKLRKGKLHCWYNARLCNVHGSLSEMSSTHAQRANERKELGKLFGSDPRHVKLCRLSGSGGKQPRSTEV